MLTDFLPHKPTPRRWFAWERTELSAMKRPAAAATLLLALLFVFQFGFLCWCNLTQWQSHLDGDSSSQILKVMEIYKAGSLSLPNWNDTTSLLLDTPLILAAFLMPLFRDPFTAYGAGNILLLIMLVYVVWQLLRRVDCAPALRLVAILLLLCPYGHAEVLGYANCMVVQSAHYLMRVIYLLYLLYCLVFLERGEKSFGHLVSCLFTWTAMSSGLFLLLIVFLPVAAGWALRVFAANQPGLFKTPGALFLVLNFLGFGAGYFVQRNVIHFSSRDSVIAWNSYSDFLPNLSKVIQGYFKLTGALPESGGVTILSGSGIAYGFAFAVALLLIGAVWFCLAYTGSSLYRGGTLPRYAVCLPALHRRGRLHDPHRSRPCLRRRNVRKPLSDFHAGGCRTACGTLSALAAAAGRLVCPRPCGDGGPGRRKYRFFGCGLCFVADLRLLYSHRSDQRLG